MESPLQKGKNIKMLIPDQYLYKGSLRALTQFNLKEQNYLLIIKTLVCSKGEKIHSGRWRMYKKEVSLK
jgi:hypothetical protein